MYELEWNYWNDDYGEIETKIFSQYNQRKSQQLADY